VRNSVVGHRFSLIPENPRFCNGKMQLYTRVFQEIENVLIVIEFAFVSNSKNYLKKLTMNKINKK